MFDWELYIGPRSKTMRVNCITTFLFHVVQCIILNQTYFFTATLISKAWLKSLYSRLGFKVIKIFVNCPNFEEDHKQFHNDSGKSKAVQKNNIDLQCLQTIPRRFTFIHDNWINLNIHKNVSRNLYVYPTPENWFQNKNIEAEIKKKL